MNSNLISKLAVVMVLVGFPLISWVYLSMGIDFRKETLKKLDAKFETLAFNIQIDSTKSISNELLTKNTSLVCFVSSDNPEIKLLINTSLEQLKDRNDFMVLMLHNQNDLCNYSNLQIECSKLSLDILKSIKHNNFGVPKHMKNNVIALVDTAQVIRNYYDLDSININEVYEDLVFILPPEAENNVAIKR